MWLSQITQEVAKTTQAESQNLHGRPGPFVCLNKHLQVIPRAQGRIHPSSTGMGEWHLPGCNGDISGKVEAFQSGTKSLCPSAGPTSARPPSAQEGPHFRSCSSGLCGEAWLPASLGPKEGRFLFRGLSHSLPLIHSLDGTELDVSLVSPLLWLLSLIINPAAFSPPPKPQSGSSSLYPNSLPPFVVEKVVGHQRQSLGCRWGLPKYSPLTLSASSAAHPGVVTRRGQEGRWGSPSPGSLPLS